MSENKKLYTKLDKFFYGWVFGVLISAAAFGILTNKHTESVNRVAKLHVKTVALTDKNCNDCHLGTSFVNLFGHPVVKSNDNTVRLMLDKAHIKQW